MYNEYDVIIVGAGAAGIGAARRLADQGKAALLLEASSRLGGRAFTQDLGGYPLDLGCEWLHSGDRNAWVGIAEASGFPVDHPEVAVEEAGEHHAVAGNPHQEGGRPVGDQQPLQVDLLLDEVVGWAREAGTHGFRQDGDGCRQPDHDARDLHARDPNPTEQKWNTTAGSRQASQLGLRHAA
ncbi:Pseudooxynicotine oxidase [Methylobacterium isbiliense]|jgi:hypothetical protein|uniref:Pseudooxynicotine oxidase n=1 Tax=Methylobacterium isbiliense TaxID=315478 RepID=A0ABQ4S6X0_9HYPH|nr:Pseudooxynicotine oxidase [Methylobacterium isbiliense]